LTASGKTSTTDTPAKITIPDDPIEFIEKTLGETLTEDVKEFIRSVVKYRTTLARSANSTGKSFALARIAIWFLLRWEDSKVFTAAAPPESNLRNILWGQIYALTEKHRHLFNGFKINDLHISRRSNQESFLTGVTIPTTGTTAKREAAFSGKHAPHLLFICDEGDGVPAEVYKGIESCMTGGFNRSVICFNPRHPSGRLYQMERKHEANVIELNAFRHINVITGEDILPGAVDRETTLRRMNEWSVPLLDGEKIDKDCYEVPDFLVGTIGKSLGGIDYPPMPSGYRRITEPVFSYMVLGQYPSEGEGQLIKRQWIDAAFERWKEYTRRNSLVPPKGIQPVLGLDVAEFGIDKNVLCLRYGHYIAPLQIWGDVDVIVTADKAAGIYIHENCARACVDATGVGSGVAPAMERYEGVEAYPVKVASSPSLAVDEGEFYQLRDQLWWMLREWLRKSPDAMLPCPSEDEGEALADELLAVRYEKMSGGAGKLKVSNKDEIREALGGKSPDRAEAIMLTFFNETVDPEDINGPLYHALFLHRGQLTNRKIPR
jgi:hypothetical protein